MRAGEAHKRNEVLALAQAFRCLMDLIVLVQAVELELKAVLFFNEVSCRVVQVDIVQDMRKSKSRQQEQDKQPFTGLFKLSVFVEKAETVIEPVYDERHGNHNDIFNQGLQRRHGNSRAKATAVAIIAGGSHNKNKVDTKHDQGDHRELNREAPDVQTRDEQEADEELQAYHKTGDERRQPPAADTKINKGKFERLDRFQFGVSAV